ncbi:MAG: SsrA-binding protein [Bdellovibrionales bacterium RIFOXYC1_FULL_54_43]|nr:MAG: SsrA-binding protein [Bdellovibrionales bacterium RIFOXYC1_FULL_54_43]OFZ85118.1 MAG: SsrA-binding protein [Bdellovibrionales bacterium RIFOXYD1_FULL_55_31]
MTAERKGSGEKLIATNSAARANYFIEEVVEAGMVLMGTEIKSLRQQAPNLRDAYVEISRTSASTEAWLLNAHIAPYSHGNIWNHDPLRKRKLLLHRHQIEKILGAVTQKGITVIPLRMYFKSGRAKVELGLGKGKKKYDKRQELKKKSAEREMDVAKKKER